MPFADANSQFEPLLFQMKQYKNLTKSTIEILPMEEEEEEFIQNCTRTGRDS